MNDDQKYFDCAANDEDDPGYLHMASQLDADGELRVTLRTNGTHNGPIWLNEASQIGLRNHLNTLIRGGSPPPPAAPQIPALNVLYPIGYLTDGRQIVQDRLGTIMLVDGGESAVRSPIGGITEVAGDGSGPPRAEGRELIPCSTRGPHVAHDWSRGPHPDTGWQTVNVRCPGKFLSVILCDDVRPDQEHGGHVWNQPSPSGRYTPRWCLGRPEPDKPGD